MKKIFILLIFFGVGFVFLYSLYGQKTISLNQTAIDAGPTVLHIEGRNIWLVWRNDNDTQIYYKVTSDNGNSWSPPYLLSDGRKNLWPFITQTSDGKIWIMWTADRQNRDIFYRTTSDEGLNWSLIKKIDTPESYCTRPTMMETENGELWILWGHHYKSSTDRGNSWGNVMDSPVTSNQPLAFDLLSPVNNLWTNNKMPVFGWQASSDIDTGSILYTLYIDGIKKNIYKDNTQTRLNSPITYNSHSWYVIAKDRESSTTQSGQTFTLNVIPPIDIHFPDKRTKGIISLGGEISYDILVNNTTSVPAFFSLDVSKDLKKAGIYYLLVPDTINLSAGQVTKLKLTITVDSLYKIDSDIDTLIFNVFTLNNDVKSVSNTLLIERIPIVHDLVPEEKAIIASNDVTFSWYTYTEATSKIYLRSEDEVNYKEYHGDPGRLHSVTAYSLSRNKNYYFKTESSSSAGTYITPEERSFYISNGIVFKKKVYDFKIKRDYSQMWTIDGQPIKVVVKNIDSKSHNFYLKVESPFSELPLGFIGKGSKDEKIQLGPYDSTEVSLVIHAQNVPVTIDKSYQDYSVLATLISEDEVDTMKAIARINVHVKVPYTKFDIREIASKYPSRLLSKRFRLTNSNDEDPITDLTLHICEELRNVIIVDPNIENVNLLPSQVIEFEIIPNLSYFFKNPTAPTSGTLTFTVADKEKIIHVDFFCPEGQNLIPVTLENVIFTSKTIAGWCTNAAPLYTEFKLPGEIDIENISKMNITLKFIPVSSHIKPHNTTIFLNDHEIYALRETVPSGAFTFEVDKDYLNYTDIGFATNRIKIGSTMHRGSTLKVYNIEIWITIKEMQTIVCAPNDKKAQKNTNWGLFKAEPASYNVNITKPDSTYKVTIGKPVTIKAKLEKPNPYLYVMATFSNGDKAIRLKSEGNGQKYTGNWIPSNPSDRNGNFIITVIAGACKNGKDKRIVGSFPIIYPDIEKINLLPIKWITDKNDPYQGRIQITIKNRDSDNYSPKCLLNVRCIKIEDSDTSLSDVDSLLDNNVISDRIVRLKSLKIPSLRPTSDMLFTLDWETKDWGEYRFFAETIIDSCNNQGLSLNKKQKYSTIYTIPKWDEDRISISVKDTFNIKVNRYKEIEVPIVAKVFFEQCSMKVKSLYSNNTIYPAAPLSTIIERLKNNDSLRIILQGFVDSTNLESDIGLASERAKAVKDLLLTQKVDSNQIKIERPINPSKRMIKLKDIHSSEDSNYIHQENRRVELSASDEQTLWKLFKPKTITVNETINLQDTTLDTPMFRSNIVVSAPTIIDWYLVIIDPIDKKTVTRLKNFDMEYNNSIKGNSLIWRTLENSTKFNRTFNCYLVIIDSTENEKRIFRTPQESIFLKEKETVKMDQIFSLLKFDSTETIFKFYKDQRIVSIINSMAELIDTVPTMKSDFMIRFEGHADVIGPAERNQVLSKQRAEETQQHFLDFINNKLSAKPYNPIYQKLRDAIENAQIVSYSNKQPLYLDISGKGHILIGDNNTPIGRNLNRRVVIQFYQLFNYPK
jgi:outer membrane protein OmpA-like peptidoglycan-associated protein